MKQSVLFVLLAFLLTFGSEKGPTNAIDIHPMAFLNGFSLGYGHLFGKRTGVHVEGTATLWDPFQMKRRGGLGRIYVPIYFHTKKSHSGMNSPFAAPIIEYSESALDLEGSNSTYNYETKEYEKDTTRYSYNAFSLGAMVGRRWTLKSGFSMGFHSGYSFPVYYKSEWGDNPNAFLGSERNTMDKIFRATAGITFVFHVGYAF